MRNGKMIISRTPFRISFAGGGTDLREYYSHGYGAVTSVTIDKYIYITVNKRFDDTIRISYSKTEIVDDVDKIQHNIVRECLKLTGILKGVEITSVADIPAGTGLGSSSSFTVGLLNALYTYKGEQKSSKYLANKACEIEIEILGEPIGKQDQYAAAFGNINYFRFNADETFSREPISLDTHEMKTLNKKLLLFYTGITRAAGDILLNQKQETKNKLHYLQQMRDQADEIKNVLLQEGINQRFGEILHNGWTIKKQLTNMISSNKIDEYYVKACEAGAVGGKILGAGGGGFLLFYCDENKQNNVREALQELREIDFNIAKHGSRIIYLGDE
jgi:D-glycero-alpha-D-manno-heptose-7-phosphate kinase